MNFLYFIATALAVFALTSAHEHGQNHSHGNGQGHGHWQGHKLEKWQGHLDSFVRENRISCRDNTTGHVLVPTAFALPALVLPPRHGGHQIGVHLALHNHTRQPRFSHIFGEHGHAVNITGNHGMHSHGPRPHHFSLEICLNETRLRQKTLASLSTLSASLNALINILTANQNIQSMTRAYMSLVGIHEDASFVKELLNPSNQTQSHAGEKNAGCFVDVVKFNRDFYVSCDDTTVTSKIVFNATAWHNKTVCLNSVTLTEAITSDLNLLSTNIEVLIRAAESSQNKHEQSKGFYALFGINVSAECSNKLAKSLPSSTSTSSQ